ncbi:MAG: helix-turn-helix domain-containing protein [Actinomycetota bacterium]
MADTTSTDRQQRIESIAAAAIPVFAAQGYRGTSMADIAAAAGMSRPALYQYFDNRSDLFRIAFGSLLEANTDAALAALDHPGDLVDQLDGYLQRLTGDGYAQLAATPHGAELMDAKHDVAADVGTSAFARAHAGLRTSLAKRNTSPDRIAAAVDLLVLSPLGLKSDYPAPTVYRTRLTALARAAVALLDD